jgi:cellulose 1,4-beta-cellobiosidase
LFRACFPWVLAGAFACSGAVAPEQRQVVPPSPAPSSIPVLGPAPAVNPFDGARFYVDPEYVQKVRAAAAAAPDRADELRKLEVVGTGLWVWSISDLSKVGPALADAAQQSASGAPVVPLFVVGNMPGRECAWDGQGELDRDGDGERRYQREFIDPLAERFAAHPQQRVAVILEPSVLGTLATSSAPACSTAALTFRRALAYALRKLSQPNVFIYLDAGSMTAHCWNINRPRLVQVYKEILRDAGGTNLIRGFATNVGNYNLFDGEMDKRVANGNPCANEHEYIGRLTKDLAKVGIVDKAFLVDTSRNGQGGIRTSLDNWCNIKGAGVGARPRAAPAARVDAFVWAKPPGESDGSADRSAPGFNAACQSSDSTPGAPTAGAWFQTHFLALVAKANPPL